MDGLQAYPEYDLASEGQERLVLQHLEPTNSESKFSLDYIRWLMNCSA